MLDRDINISEVEKVLKLLKQNKSPGEDGIISEFYVLYWDIIKEDFFSLLQEIFNDTILSNSQHKGVLTLLHKGGERENIKNWRPLTLLNCDYKIIAKILSERLKIVLPKIIHTDQKGFVKGRNISEANRMIQDIIEYIDNEDEEGIILFLDQQKAFDRVEWEWIDFVLEKFEFGGKFRAWIKMLLYNATTCIKTNGFVSRYFSITRSARQGCPIAPLLYIIQAEPMACAIRGDIKIEGLKLPGGGGNFIETKLCMFADDTQDIQKDPRVKEKFSFYSKFHGYDIRNRYGAEKVKSGLRVMRPPSWKPPDGYEYKDCRLIGTIFHVAKSGAVKVQWDISKEIENCVKKSNGQYELLVYDNAQIGVTHSHVQCDGCSEYPLRGIRWKCVNCPDFDLCSSCYMNDEHDINGHIFKRIQSENAKGVQMMSRIREDCFEDMTAAIGITEGTTVQLRSDDSCVGTVRKLVHKKIDVFRSDAKVKSKGIEVRYALGREGKCDLKFTKEGAGPVFYVDHLPVVSSESASPGLRVVRGPAWNENYKDDDGGLGYLGTMIKVHRKSTKNATTDDQSAENQKKSSEPKIVEVQWDNGNIRSYNLQNEILRMFDNGPIGVEHESYFCDICNSPGEYNECIKGFRWRCLECSDYDLCNKCYMEDKDDITHRFQRVSAPNNWEQHNSIFCRENSKKIQSYGIFEGAEVVELVAQDNDKTNSDKQTGTVKEICNCKIDNGRSDVEVHWSDRKESQTECISKHDFLDLVLRDYTFAGKGTALEDVTLAFRRMIDQPTSPDMDLIMSLIKRYVVLM
ncbi:uncharacterized protein LOC134727487 [Mytilus trossulus]|uniref:uncharacterized protein LOC134727487 n=1 Tax=Mytilus trossulus TaxID=6551 RepID=UPI003006DB0C